MFELFHKGKQSAKLIM